MSLVISTFGDNLQSELSSCLPVLVDRMGNEITRLTAVKVKYFQSTFAISEVNLELKFTVSEVKSCVEMSFYEGASY